MSLPRPLLALTAAAVTTVLALGTTQLAAGAAPPAGAPALTAEAVRLPTDGQLRAALLTATELGPQYAEIPPSEESPPDSSAGSSAGPSDATPAVGCDALRALLNGTAADDRSGSGNPHQEIEFEGTDGNPMITESLTAEEPERLTADLTTIGAAFTDCRSITFTDDFGGAVAFSVTPIALGDREGAPAVRIDGTLSGVRLNGYLGVERLGDVGLAYGFFQRESDSSELASLYYRAAVAKAERTLGLEAGSTVAPGTAV
ncbi:hypothetical protein ACFCX4_20340 [Kitasatospora sp. NPDC056327]|uniref:hypothetical protein n=1 Tax=Kitasatospora sp. NPDC056327 TaxID=3345785 RepID=UPI0035D6AE7A